MIGDGIHRALLNTGWAWDVATYTKKVVGEPGPEVHLILRPAVRPDVSNSFGRTAPWHLFLKREGAIERHVATFAGYLLLRPLTEV